MIAHLKGRSDAAGVLYARAPAFSWAVITLVVESSLLVLFMSGT